MKAKEVGRVYRIPTDRIAEFKRQPRTYFDPLKMAELEASIKRFGQRKAGEVRLLEADKQDRLDKDCELIDGARRLRVCIKLGIDFKATVVDDVRDEKKQFLYSIIANHGGAEFTELETYDDIIRLRKENPEFTIADTAAAFGCSTGTITDYLTLQRLVPEVRQMMSRELPESQRLKFTSALALVDCSPERQLMYATMATSKGLKAKQLKELVERHTGKANRDESYSPRKEHEKFHNFLQRTAIDLELMMRQPKEYFATMFEHRDAEDLTVALKVAKQSVGNMTTLVEMLERIKGAQPERKAG